MIIFSILLSLAVIICRPYQELKPGGKVPEEDIIGFVRGNNANYKAPKSIEFREELPKGGTGKILKRELRKPYWEKYLKKIN